MEKYLVLSAFVFLFLLPNNSEAATCVNVQTATTTIPAGFGAAYNLFSPTHELLIKGACTDTSVIVNVGSGQGGQYIYELGYYYDGKTWRSFTYAGAKKIGPWFVGSATVTLPSTVKETQVTAYICQLVNNTWKCGCRDGACTQAYWQSQTVVRATSGGASSGSTSNAPWVMAYYVGFQKSMMSPSDIDYGSFTHIAVGAVKPKSDGTLDADFDLPGDDGEDMAKSIARKAHREGKKALLWVGGEESRDVWQNAADDDTRKKFASNLVDLMEDLDYDGLDIDWEPIHTEDRDEVLALLKELRRQAPDALITLPVEWVGSTRDRTQELAWYADVSKYVDKIFVMTYSMTGVWSGWQSWFTSPLYGETIKTPNSINHSVESYRKAGVPKSKLGFGLGLYGRCFVQPITAPRMDIPAAYSWNVTSLPYSTVSEVLRDREAKAAWDTTARVPYVYRSTSSKTGAYCSYLSYDNEQSVREKASYLKKEGLGGVIVWTLNLGFLEDEDKQQPLLDELYKNVVNK